GFRRRQLARGYLAPDGQSSGDGQELDPARPAKPAPVSGVRQMTPQDHPQIIDSLAAEYVLGTLRGPARRRFARWRASVPQVDERCRFWEEHLLTLAKGVRPIQPPAHVWQGIRTRLGFAQTQPGWWRGRALAIAASVLLVAALSALLYWRGGPAARPTEVASI